MHSQDTINQFIALRAKGRALGAIAEQLGIGFGTAWNWAAKYKTNIDRLRALEIELIQERVLAGYEQELTHLAEELKRVQAELRERDYGYVNTDSTGIKTNSWPESIGSAPLRSVQRRRRNRLNRPLRPKLIKTDGN